MARQAVFHFPDRTEIGYLDAIPDVGEVVLNKGLAWVVTSMRDEDGDPPLCTLMQKAKSPNGHEHSRPGRRDMPPSSRRPPRARPDLN